MLDIKLLREDPEKVRKGIEAKGSDPALLVPVLEKDEKRRKLATEVDGLRARRNEVTEEIARRRREGMAAERLVEEMRALGEELKKKEEELSILERELEDLLLQLPNLPAEEVPLGYEEWENVEVRRVGEPRAFPFPPLPHWEIGVRLGILDFRRAAKISGSRFTVFWKEGALLVRALINFMLDLHVREHGYTEVYPPFLVHSRSMTGTGQLPRFGADAFSVYGHDLWLVPTAEVPVTNLHREEILPGEVLPLKYVAYTPCFRSEAGAAGRDTRGLIRQHQFDKVELVKFTRPEDSPRELESLVRDAGEVLERLGLPYRVMLMCSGETGFAARKKYDLEVWMPSYGRYVEVSSCSDFGDFQARRASIRFRREERARPEFVHTLNGSGLAVGRTLAALLENYQEEDGTVSLPETLRPYLGGLARLG